MNISNYDNKESICTIKDRIRARKLFSEKETLLSALAIISLLDGLHKENGKLGYINIVASNFVCTSKIESNNIFMIDNSIDENLSEHYPPQCTNENVCQAPEYFHGKFTELSEVYAIGALMYEMLFGIEPWAINVDMLDTTMRTLVLLKMKRKPLLIPSLNGLNPSNELMTIIGKATEYQPEKRYQSLEDLRTAISRQLSSSVKDKEQHRNIRRGNGFADIAGMDDLKEKIRYDIIDVLNDAERAKELGITIPNGILLYGPPGCGKTFFAEKCAEEMQCHFMYVKCSDVASPYIHGGQEKIARLFEEAREKSPTLLFLDEVDALLRTRTKQQNASESGEINEFLCQINNCGESGVFVIAATNMPEEIDEAALRAGRLERKYYIGVPDVQTIEKLLEIQLRKRKTDSINIKEVAKHLQGRVAADVKLLVDVAARLAFRNHCNISTQLLIEAVRTTPPSVSKAVIEEHLRIKEKFEQKQIEGKRRRIGFQ
ncbi:AAA family ATPase [Hallella faecis]|uniref:ATP-binding protein n=1 Tax=Hallella faecis TaxID=2841596 RepID=UPI003F889C7F